MTSLRFSVAKLMAVVGIAALNLAVGRALWSYAPVLALGIMPELFVLQLGLVRWIRSRGGARAFWTGFIAVGTLAALSFAWSVLFSGSIGIGYDSATGKFHRVSTPGILGGDQMQALWGSYDALAERCLESLPLVSGVMDRSEFDLTSQLTLALVNLLPQMLAALAGGSLAVLIVKSRVRSSRLSVS